MEQEPEYKKPPKNLYQKLLEIQKHIVGLGKDKKGGPYEYVTGAKVLEHIKPIMNQYGLLLKQEVTSIENTRQDYKTKYGEKSEILTKTMMRFTWIDCETGETDVNEFGANGQNDWEKGLGSALTYAERYFLLKYFHISTDEDDIDNPDRKPNKASEKAQPVKQSNGKPKQETAPQPAATTAETPNTRYASARQKEEIIRLLNNPVITREEKTKMLLNINRFDEARAADAIEKLKKVIEGREDGQASAA